MYKNIENKKNFLFRFILVITSFMVLSLNFVNGQKNFENIFSFIQCSYLFSFLILILSFINSKSKLINKFQYQKIVSKLNFISLVNILISVIILVGFIKSSGLISPKDSSNNLSLLSWLFNYILCYFIFPILLSYFVWRNYSFPSYKNLWILLIFPFFYFLIDFSIYYFRYWDGNELRYTRFISPDIQTESISLIFNLIKIMLSFLILGGSFIFIKNLKNYKLFKFFLIILSFFCISLIFYNKYDFQHMRKALLEHDIQGSLQSVESQHIAYEISSMVTNKTKDELFSNNKKILELGAGIGNITQYLVDKYGVQNIISIEINSDSCDFLRKRFPELTVIQGDVKDVQKLLKENSILLTNIEGIISTLPVTILSTETVQKLDSLIEIIMQKNNNIKYIEYQLFPFFDIIHKNKLHLIDYNKEIFKLNKKYVFTNYFIPVVLLEYTFKKKVDEETLEPSSDNHSFNNVSTFFDNGSY
ncbi:probable dimethyladenosine transferase [Candidatus Phytoplasma mali]|uniref:Probable dimethyladenosine transferase n=1 Tax=Phytoplasma mali (strain AT) TaxID=482235 RepID=B3QZS9_PHYMT|nr:SAM-dependent methyltransferase [Candidatus Phytoplasma mali]CAP18466.1 probable dimethyladenosine transferase [Candidatus Phytoplasma mali]